MKKTNFSLFLFLLVLLGVIACGGSRNEKFIQGTWGHSGDLTVGTWPVTWTFQKGKFVNTAGDPPITLYGKYRVVKEESPNITLSLYEIEDQAGHLGNDAEEVTFKTDRVEDRLYNGQDVLKRILK